MMRLSEDHFPGTSYDTLWRTVEIATIDRGLEEENALLPPLSEQNTKRKKRGENTMKNIQINSIRRKAIALLLSIAILTLAVPSALADSSTFAGTRWYATNINMDILKSIDSDAYSELKAIASLISFVPDISWLDMPSLMAICCVIDFNQNGTFTISLLGSTLGAIDWSSYNSSTGSWSCRGNMLKLTVDGESIPMNYSNGVLSLSIYGFGLDFARV